MEESEITQPNDIDPNWIKLRMYDSHTNVSITFEFCGNLPNAAIFVAYYFPKQAVQVATLDQLTITGREE